MRGWLSHRSQVLPESVVAVSEVQSKVSHGFSYVLLMWLASRLVIIVAMQLIAPLLPLQPMTIPDVVKPIFNFTPTPGFELFSHWDGDWYEKIATEGYQYDSQSSQQQSIAFFPLFPLVVRGLMVMGLPFSLAAFLINNLAFLGAAYFLFRWAAEQHGLRVARWAVAVLVWFPYSIYGTVAYTESLFLLCTTGSLWAFDQKRYRWMAFWAALATACRPPGIALVIALLLAAWKEKRPFSAYAAALAGLAGILAFALYCGLQFNDPLAFHRAQQAWDSENLMSIFQRIVLERRPNLDIATRLVVLLGSACLLGWYRKTLTPVAFLYGVSSLALILASGSTMSINRFAFGIVSLSLVSGLALARLPRLGLGVIGACAIGLSFFSIRFAWWRWVA